MAKVGTFEQFQARCDQLVTARYGVSIHDCVDAPWYDTWKGLEPDEDISDISLLDVAVEILSDADETFAQMVELVDTR